MSSQNLRSIAEPPTVERENPISMHLNHCRCWLTLVADLEAFAGAAVVSGKEQVHVIAGADEEVRGLSAVVLANQRRRIGGPVPNFQCVIINLCLKPAQEIEKKKRKNIERGMSAYDLGL